MPKGDVGNVGIMMNESFRVRKTPDAHRGKKSGQVVAKNGSTKTDEDEATRRVGPRVRGEDDGKRDETGIK